MRIRMVRHGVAGILFAVFPGIALGASYTAQVLKDGLPFTGETTALMGASASFGPELDTFYGDDIAEDSASASVHAGEGAMKAFASEGGNFSAASAASTMRATFQPEVSTFLYFVLDVSALFAFDPILGSTKDTSGDPDPTVTVSAEISGLTAAGYGRVLTSSTVALTPSGTTIEDGLFVDGDSEFRSTYLGDNLGGIRFSNATAFSSRILFPFAATGGEVYDITASFEVTADGDGRVLATSDGRNTALLSLYVPVGSLAPVFHDSGFLSSAIFAGTPSEAQVTAVPLPAAGWLLFGGLGILGAARMRAS